MDMNAVTLARWGCGWFFLVALLTGVWKYKCIVSSEEAKAPVYVDIAHRAAFLYAFSCLLFAHFAQLSRWPEQWNFFGVAVALLFFVTAHGTYLVHGFLRDTDNQMQKPYRVGQQKIPAAVMHGYMIALIVGEIGGFLVVFSGAMIA